MEDHFDRLLNVDHTSSSSSSIGAPTGKFVESSKYTGSKKGYVFKLGEKGLGYYWDRGDNRYASSTTEQRKDEEDEDEEDEEDEEGDEEEEEYEGEPTEAA